MAIDWDLVKILFCLFVAMLVPLDDVKAAEVENPPVFIVSETASVVGMVLQSEQKIMVGSKEYFRCSYRGKYNFTSAITSEFIRTDGLGCKLNETFTVKMTPVLPNL